jgi:phosphatidylserine/phosphatidylglycerophosphate/cardiolipin synthase-like enzyme
MLDGEVARALGGLVRERWRKASGEILIAPTEPVGSRVDLWPDICTPALRNLHVAIMRTEPYWLSQPEIRENEAAYLDAIAAAKKLIYLENQYFASAVVGDALAARLGEAEGPEIVVICAARAPSFFDKLAMDSARNALLRRLRAADHPGRLQVYRPRTKGGRTIILHSKVACFDERLIRIGSSNLNNRSFGYDSECDIAIEVGASQPAETGPAIAAFRDELIGHFLGLRGEDFARAYEQEGSAIKAIAKLNHPRKPRLKIIRNRPLSFLSSLIARWHLGDPAGVRDAWRPWRRVAYFRQRRLTKS